jgi:hypothetical protein
VDGDGNVLVTGYAEGNNYADYATLKYSNSGVPLWTNRYNGAGNGNDVANAIAVNSAGEVYVTGYGSASSEEFVTIKYSSSGETLWTRKFHGAGVALPRFGGQWVYA